MSAPRVEAAKRFVVMSGLPGSGKTTLARRLASVLHQQIIDKDDILEGLFESEGFGDPLFRRTLSLDTAVREICSAFSIHRQ